MEHMKTVNVAAFTREEIDFTTCDLCGERITNQSYEVNEVEVSHKTGTAYPEGGHGETIHFDICGPCFTGKLVPWLSAQGAEPCVEEWDF